MAELAMSDLMFREGLMQGQRILITGGGTGLGKVMAEACAMLGADVVIWGRRGGVVADAAKARHIATFREEQSKSKALGAKGSRLTLESLQAQIAEGGMKELPLIVKAR